MRWWRAELERSASRDVKKSRRIEWRLVSTEMRCQAAAGGSSGHQQKGGGGLLLRYIYTKTGRLVVDVLREKHPVMLVPPMEIPKCVAFEEYDEVPDTVPLDFLDYDVSWVVS